MAVSYNRVEFSKADGWVNVTGSLSGVAGVTWQNLSGDAVDIAFVDGAGEPGQQGQVLPSMAAYYDKNGSTSIWVKALASTGIIAATAD
jgi:hypothetical protein